MITIILPWPNPKLSPNARPNRWDKAVLVRDAREAGYFAVKELGPGEAARCDSYPVRVVFCPPDKRGRDLDNAYASLKPALDGVADALGVNDRQFYPVHLNWGDPCQGGRVLLTLWRVTVTV